ncbi:hypothetical protein SMMN14_01564 [Sphaerulina musiva]
MGNCFGKSSSNANFQGEGRTIGGGAGGGGGASPAQAPRPAAAPPPKVTGPGRTLGDNTAPSPSSDAQTPASAAARAAEERLKAAQGKGKLGKQLDAQKSQTQKDTLASTARENVAAREADAVAQARAYN